MLADRAIWPDAILRVVEERTGGRRFKAIEDVISREEMLQWLRDTPASIAQALGIKAAQ